MYIADAKGCQKQRINDRVLMDDCIQLYKNGKLSAAEVEDINICRLYAKVETLAVVSNPQGTELQRGIFSNALTSEATSLQLFPQQGKPADGARAIITWKKFLGRYTTDGYKLSTPLCEWTGEPTMSWPSRYHEESHQIAILDEGRWSYFPLQTEHRREYDVQENATANDQDTPHGLPVSWHNKTRGKVCDKPLPRQIMATPQIIDQTNFWQIFQSFPAWERNLIPAELFDESRDQSRWRLMDAIVNREDLQIVVDGAAAGGVGIYSWGIREGKGATTMTETTGEASGNPLTDRRATLCGILSALCTLRRVAEAYGAASIGDIQVLTSNKKITRQLQAAIGTDVTRWLRDCVLADFDVIKETVATCQEMRISIQFLHRTRVISANRNEAISDSDAKAQRDQDRVHESTTERLIHRVSHQQKTTEQLPLPSTKVYLYRNGRIVTSGEREVLRRALPEHELATYLQRRNKWDETQMDEIDWASREQAMTRLNTGTHKHVVKISCGWLPTAARQAAIKAAEMDECHLCGQPDTYEHLFTCQCRDDWGHAFREQLQQHLKKTKTEPTVYDKIDDAIGDWLFRKHEFDDDGNERPASVGIDLIRGFIPLEWTEQQTQYGTTLDTIDERKGYASGTTWGSKLIAFFWKQSHDLWLNRCEEVHAKSLDSNKTQARKELEARAQRLYQQAEKVTVVDRLLFQSR